MIDQDDLGALEALKRACETRGIADEQALMQWIATQPADQRAHLEDVAKEVLAARGVVSDVPVPPGLESRLALIAAAPPPWHWRDLLQYPLKNWQIAAALAVVAVMVAISIWPQEPRQLPSLDDQVVQLISKSASTNAANPLKLSAADSASVLAMLKGQGLPFEVKMPKMQAQAMLLGAGVTRFGNAAAVFTRWHSGSETYTLYQFDAASLKLPANFLTANSRGQTPAQHVVIWSGASDNYAWAMIGSAGCEDNPFMGEAE